MYVRNNVMFVELNTHSDSYARSASTRVLDNGVNDLDNKQGTIVTTSNVIIDR